LQSGRTGLNGGALHVVQDAADAAHLLAAASPAWSAVDERRQRRAVPGGLLRVGGVENQQPAVPRRHAKHHLADEVRVAADHRADQAAAATGRECHQLRGGGVRQQRRDWSERLDLMRRGLGPIIEPQQDRSHECAALRVGVQHLRLLRVSKHQLAGGEQQLQRTADLLPLLQAG
jgi:hypothetical protein